MLDNTRRFTGRAADYDQYRERYDASIVLPRLREWCDLTPDWLIADIGAGTGMLADIFLANGNSVFAVEPNAEMRRACILLHPGQHLLQVVDGTAEATTIAAHSIDLVCCGRAFHWFDVDQAMAEARRILRTDGWFVSVAFGRADDALDANLAIEALLRSMTSSGNSTRDAYAKYARLPEFLVRDYRQEQIEGAMLLTWPELLGLMRSLSHSPLPEDPRFPEFEGRLRDVFSRYAVEDRITLATRYWINVGRF
ncbi:Ubiquinone/menaquinone biosynthesis C-methylase UbiE [Bryocella elongata]|uniref:Ubiquinone/menaquinone biosynthesis C-methylase UbiE n=2 Tax=Bryocella elongata TaxID=863522 RepID=A0A1H5X128_9BACT|nr:Ubiquinone/menaquinone biosynthesis C-methylase UbiE [Bryocella elongata]